jgi:hypothetical protein
MRMTGIDYEELNNIQFNFEFIYLYYESLSVEEYRMPCILEVSERPKQWVEDE